MTNQVTQQEKLFRLLAADPEIRNTVAVADLPLGIALQL